MGTVPKLPRKRTATQTDLKLNRTTGNWRANLFTLSEMKSLSERFFVAVLPKMTKVTTSLLRMERKNEPLLGSWMDWQDLTCTVYSPHR